MADQLQLKFDDNGFREFLENVKASKLKSSLRVGMRKSLNIIKRQTTINLKAIKYKSGSLDTSSPVIFKNKYGSKYIFPAFPKSIFVRVAKSGKVGHVTIRKPKERTSNPILTFIHNAKGVRSTKKHSTGSIGPHNFFAKAVEQTKSRVDSELQTNILNAIQKAKERYHK